MPASDARAERRREARRRQAVPAVPRNRPDELHLDDDTWQRLERFADLVLERNRAHNLVSRRDAKNLWSRHVLDSLRLLPLVADCKQLLDIGSGGGFPGLVLAAAMPGCQVTLAERMTKKARFLSTAARLLGLGNVTVWNQDVAELGQEQQFDAVTARAVATVDVLWPVAAPRLASGGGLYVFVGAEDEPSQKWQNPPGTTLERVERVERVAISDDDSEGAIVIVRQDAAKSGDNQE